ncbi:MAG: DUF565 domain-containing protein [Oscillatoriophycideae cyanobacterium NC_groundwater_1537_Pr4_S-0.65um_50_18]|nr:DUF565 domain-containing protein [Oscillatoriophycideae cyanobacterium NC_groundwater_1537_Pr4_S-0.65um_50_18]
MQNTRLNTLVDRLFGQFGRWLRNPWRRISLLLISLLMGNFLATTISTIAGQKAEPDVAIAALLVFASEGISWWVYRGRSGQNTPSADRANSVLLELLNGTKLGLTYGLFVEAFKLGS